MPRRHSAGLRLVVNNIHGLNSKQPHISLQTEWLQGAIYFSKQRSRVWKSPLGLPIANCSGNTTAYFSRSRGPAKPANNVRNFGERSMVHTFKYSRYMNFVKSMNGESQVFALKTKICGMQQSVLSDQAAAVSLRLRAARMSIPKLTQVKACEQLHVGKSTWNQWEMGINQPDPLVLAKFADTYGISLDWIYRGRADTMPASMAERVIAKHEELLAKPKLDTAV